MISFPSKQNKTIEIHKVLNKSHPIHSCNLMGHKIQAIILPQMCCPNNKIAIVPKMAKRDKIPPLA